MGGLVVLWVAVLTWVLIVSINPTSQEEIERACIEHNGVQQFVDTTWSATEGAGTVVCKDGTVQKANG